MGLFGKKTNENDQDNSDNEGTEKINKPVDGSGRKKIIYIVCTLLIVGLVLEGEMNDEGDGGDKESKPVKKKRRVKKKPKKKPVKKPEMKPKSEPEKKMVKRPERQPIKMPEIQPTVKPEMTDNPIKKIEPIKKMPEPERESVELSKDFLSPKKMTMSDQDTETKTNDESLDEEDLDKMTEKKEEKAVFAPAPLYTSIGRGLVYDCVDLHWACINRSSYFQCRNNKKWNIEQGKKIECVDFQVYASVDDCEAAQQLNVDMIKNVQESCQQNSGSDE